MRRDRRVRASCIGGMLLSLAMARIAPAQAIRCDETQSAEACFQRYYEPLKKHTKKAASNATNAMAKAIKDGVGGKPTGSEPSASGAATGIKDFLPELASALSIPGFAGTGRGIDLQKNFDATGPVWQFPGTLQFSAVSAQPKLYDALLATTPDAKRSALSDSVTKTINDLADVTLGASLNAESKSWGRSFRSSAREIDNLTDAVLAQFEEGNTSQERAFNALMREPAVVAQARACNNGIPVSVRLSCFTDSIRTRIEEIAEAAAVADAAIENAERDTLRAYHLDQLENLINNQPQVNGTAKYRLRQEQVGPREGTATMRWEFSPVSLNAAHEYCASATGSRTLTPSCYKAYLEQPGVLQSLSSGLRLWLTTDISQSSAYDFALPTAASRTTLPASYALEPAAGMGAYFAGAQRSRVDVELRYRWSSEQKVRENRFVGTATLTQKVNDASSGVLTIRYANKPEFLGIVDRQLTANLGLSYKLPSLE